MNTYISVFIYYVTGEDYSSQFYKEELIMASNKNFMNFISNEVAKKNLSDNPMVKFALKDFEDTSMKICKAIDAKDKDSTGKYLTEVTIKLRTFVSYAWAAGIINSDELLGYKATIDNFVRNEKKKFNDYFKEVA